MARIGPLRIVRMAFFRIASGLLRAIRWVHGGGVVEEGRGSDGGSISVDVADALRDVAVTMGERRIRHPPRAAPFVLDEADSLQSAECVADLVSSRLDDPRRLRRRGLGDAGPTGAVLD